MPIHPQNVLALLVVALVLVAAAWDYRTGLIPNRLVLTGLVVLLLAHVGLVVAFEGAAGIGTALSVSGMGLFLCGLIPATLYFFAGGIGDGDQRAMGGGDIKLLAVCGAGLGPIVGLEAQLYAFGGGALFATARAAYEGVLWQVLMGSATMLTNPLLPARMRRAVPASAATPVRFGPAIAFGVVAAVVLHWSNA